MALVSAAGTLLIDTGVATTTYSVTGLSFEPSCYILFGVGRSDATDAAGEVTSRCTFGFACNKATDEQAVIARQSEHSAATTATDRAFQTDAVALSISTAGAIDGRANHSAFNSDGFTVVIGTQFATAIRVGYLAIGGLTDVDIGVFNLPTSVTTLDVTAPGFQPDFGILLSICNSSDSPALSAEGIQSIGMFSYDGSTIDQCVLANWSSDAAANSDTYSYIKSGEIFAGLINPIDRRGAISAVLSNGFTYSMTETTGSAFRVAYLVGAGGDFKVTSVSTRTDGNDIAVTGLSFQPVGGLLMSAGRVESTADTATADDHWAVGAFSSTTARAAVVARDKDASANSDVATAIEHDGCLVLMDGAAAMAVDAVMDVKSIEATGVTFVMDDAAAAASFVPMLLFGDAAAGGSSIAAIAKYYAQMRSQ